MLQANCSFLCIQFENMISKLASMNEATCLPQLLQALVISHEQYITFTDNCYLRACSVTAEGNLDHASVLSKVVVNKFSQQLLKLVCHS